MLECGVHLGLPGFSFANDKGEWSGLDVDYCRALAAAILGDASKVKFTPTSVQQRWPILQSGQVDVLSRNTTITFSRNATLGVNFQGINFYEGQTFIAKTASRRQGAQGSRRRDRLRRRRLDRGEERGRLVQASATSRSRSSISRRTTTPSRPMIPAAATPTRPGVGALAGQRIKLKTPGDHLIMTETISNDPQGPVTRWGDDRFQAVVRWVLNGRSRPSCSASPPRTSTR